MGAKAYRLVSQKLNGRRADGIVAGLPVHRQPAAGVEVRVSPGQSRLAPVLNRSIEAGLAGSEMKLVCRS
jgi:hypothetical protein